MFRIQSTVFALLALLATSAVAVDAQLAAKRTTLMFDTIKAYKDNDDSSSKAIDAFINFDHIIDESIRPHRAKFSAGQASEFKRLLLELARKVAYPRGSNFLNTTRLKFVGKKGGDTQAVVTYSVHIEKDDIDMDVGYIWQKFGANVMLADVSFDGDSLVKDYQNQFGRIIEKDGVDALIKKVKDKLAEYKTGAK